MAHHAIATVCRKCRRAMLPFSTEEVRGPKGVPVCVDVSECPNCGRLVAMQRADVMTVAVKEVA